ncbi:MAG TPA: hypothetical protein VK790_11475 [Solirubrobacteraceae bacterium]|nr:hypothetical protein [Solirubrobacteraceae bacterium]
MTGATLALLAAVLLASAQVALAVFSKTAAGGPLTVATSTLAAPGKATATQVNCHVNKNPEVEVRWSATSSGYASTYTVERATASAGPYTSVGSVPIGETSYTDQSASLAYSSTYYYRVSAVYRSWNAASTSGSVKTLGKSCL